MTEYAPDAEGKLLRVFVDERDEYCGVPVYRALVDALREAGFSGATVFKGIEGYGARRVVHSARSVDASVGLPVLIEVAEAEAKILAFLPTLERIVNEGGLATIERLRLSRIGTGGGA